MSKLECLDYVSKINKISEGRFVDHSTNENDNYSVHISGLLEFLDDKKEKYSLIGDVQATEMLRDSFELVKKRLFKIEEDVLRECFSKLQKRRKSCLKSPQKV